MGCSGSKKQPETCNHELQADFKVTVERDSVEVPIGLLVTAEYENQTYRVHGVREEGVIPAWNQKNAGTPDLLVQEGDIIVIVNGVVGNLDAMEKELKAKKITFAIKRGSETAPALADPASLEVKQEQRSKSKSTLIVEEPVDAPEPEPVPSTSNDVGSSETVEGATEAKKEAPAPDEAENTPPQVTPPPVSTITTTEDQEYTPPDMAAGDGAAATNSCCRFNAW